MISRLPGFHQGRTITEYYEEREQIGPPFLSFRWKPFYGSRGLFVPGNEVISDNFLTRRFRLRDQNKECSQLLRQGYACFFMKPLAWFISSLIFWEQTSGATVRQGLLFYQIIVEFNV